MSPQLLLVLAIDRIAWLFELLAEAIIDRMWHAIEDERPVWPELLRWLLR